MRYPGGVRVDIEVHGDQVRGLPTTFDYDYFLALCRIADEGGVDSYLRYTREVQPHLDRVGGFVRYCGHNPHNVIGDGERPWWDAILIVEYPSSRAFSDMVTDPGYQQVHGHRAAALTRGDLVATSQWVLG